MSTNMDILRGKMAEKRINGEEMVQKIGVDTSTFYRKMKADGMSFSSDYLLGLTEEENF